MSLPPRLSVEHGRIAATLTCASVVAVVGWGSVALADDELAPTSPMQANAITPPSTTDEPPTSEQPTADPEPVSADSPPPVSRPTATANESKERTAADVESAPLPGNEDGRIGPRPKDSLLRDIGQGALVVPRAAFELAMAPVRASLWTYDRYQLKNRFNRLFFDDSFTYGIYPTINFDSLYGITYGARMVHRNLFGEREHFAMRGALGGAYREMIDGHLRSGLRLGTRTSAELRGQYELRPRDAFYGIGNVDDAMETRHRQKMSRAVAIVDVRAVDSLHVRAASAITDLAYSRSESDVPAIDMAYPTDMLTGWPATRNVYGELELRYDRRGRTTTLDQHATFDRGALVSVYAGPLHQLKAGGDYWRYGGEAQTFIPLGPGPRALAARVRLDAVTGGYDDVAFTQLPQLGGKRYLRGYSTDRFRDRVAALSSLEYQWDLSRMLMAALFVDVGRVYPALGDIALRDLRMGYGISLQLHDNLSYIADISLASSIDGGVFINFSFDPVFVLESRVETR